ncbi:adenine-specific methyltransferase EcoRI family protein [Ammonicoccus fulvus]|uniref:Adenine-specific methyltransferase EcoRI family protein n=1 Tax=Ammonicoccus fulvus TaxID=3138240 RepID=A0ABZ3FUW0_9ACTN
MANRNLNAAKAAKRDEFYTQWVDIEREMNAYLEFDPDVFRGKTILLPCDDPEWSNFTKFFALHFADFGLKKLISTSYAPNSNAGAAFYTPTLFETEADGYDEAKSLERGRVFTLTPDDISGDGRVDIDDLKWEYLEGDGDFRSAEVTALRDEADMVITNPPFSLARPFIAWLVEGGVQFSIIGGKNAATYKEIFPLIRDNQMWLGKGFARGDAYFRVPDEAKTDYAQGVYDASTQLVHFRNISWYTNIEHGRRHEPLYLMTMADNLKYNKKLLKKLDGASDYFNYDNYEAIEVPYLDAIPSDHLGVMGVPITFLDKYNPDQFEIVGTNRYTIPHGMSQKFVDDYYASGQKGQISEGHPDLCYYDFHGRPVVTYDRILIRHRNPEPKKG